MFTRMDYLAAEGAHLLERCREVRNGEIREREAVSRARAALVDADRDSRVHGLPTPAVVRASRLERHPKQPLPEASSPLRHIGRKLDQKWWRRHDPDGTRRRQQPDATEKAAAAFQASAQGAQRSAA